MWPRFLKFFLTALLVGSVYLAADWRAVLATLAGLDRGTLALALALFVPQTLVSAVRWQAWAMGLRPMSLAEALRQTLASSAANLVVPAKLGDFSKAALLAEGQVGSGAAATKLVIGEKLADLAGLSTVMLAGGAALVWPNFAWGTVSGAGLGVALGLLVARKWWTPPAELAPRLRAAELAVASLVLWTLHVAQIELFCRAAGVVVAWPVAAWRLPWALFAGLVPISLWGLGTRDTALVLLYQDVAPAATMAAVGTLTALRYLIPGLCGIPFLSARAQQAAATRELRRKQQPQRRRAA